MTKRLLDIVVSSLALLLLSPVLIAVALVVRVSMGSPVLFVHERAGRGAVPFGLMKFRTMRHPGPDESAPVHDMNRITPLGRFLRRTSLDELPSLVNVLRGELSLVGPRPLPVAYVSRYTPDQARRLDVRPGLTGWAVVHGRNLVDWDERFEFDCWYIDHQSLLLDLRILGRTVGIVLGGVGVNRSDRTTMDEFRSDASLAPGSALRAKPVEPKTDPHG